MFAVGFLEDKPTMHDGDPAYELESSRHHELQGLYRWEGVVDFASKHVIDCLVGILPDQIHHALDCLVSGEHQKQG
jgi:hypothetical protein